MSAEEHENWEQLRMDPDPQEDLGYEPSEWDVLSVETDGRNQRLFLPADEGDLREDAFIVADSSALCDVADCR